MSYTWRLYRKFRPQEFADVKGQEHIVTTLKEPDQRPTESAMHICSAEREEPVRQPQSPRYLPRPSTANIP